MATHILQASQLVLSGTDAVDTYVPAVDEVINPIVFLASVPGSSNASVRLLWDYGEAGEEVLWSLVDSGAMPPGLLSLSRTGDGAKKFALCLHNACSSDYDFSAECILEKK